jgi:hypothetical protein
MSITTNQTRSGGRHASGNQNAGIAVPGVEASTRSLAGTRPSQRTGGHFLISLFQWVAFVAGLAACVGASHIHSLHGNSAHVVSYAGILVSLVFGTLVARKEPLKSWLATRPVLWFLFVFNGAVAVGAGLFVHGAQGIGTAIGMGLVSIGAGTGLLRSKPRRTEPSNAQS